MTQIDSDNALEKRLHIVLSPGNLSDNYNRHCGVVMYSLLEHCTQPVQFHILHNEKYTLGHEKEVEYNKLCYQKIADKFNAKILYHHVDVPEWTSNVPRINYFTPISLYRLYIPDIL